MLLLKQNGSALDALIEKANNLPDAGGDTTFEDDFLKRSLSGAYVNNRITSIGQYAFRGCTKITSMSFAEVKSVATNAIYGCTALTSIELPKATSISSNAFNSCSKLTSVNVPLLTSIDSYAFRSCSVLEFIDLQKAATLNNTFYGCPKLKIVVLRKTDGITTLSNTSTFTQTPFASNGSGGKVFVPQALIGTYQGATNWSTLYAAGTCEFVAIEGSIYE